MNPLIRLMVLASASTFMAGCLTGQSEDDPYGMRVDARMCKAQGGRVEAPLPMGWKRCVIPFADAGKPCSDKRDCLGTVFLVQTICSVIPSGRLQKDSAKPITLASVASPKFGTEA